MASIEVFTAAGGVTITSQIFPTSASTGVALFVAGGSAALIEPTIRAPQG